MYELKLKHCKTGNIFRAPLLPHHQIFHLQTLNRSDIRNGKIVGIFEETCLIYDYDDILNVLDQNKGYKGISYLVFLPGVGGKILLTPKH